MSHDPLCERTFPGTALCRCDERRAGTEIDPTLLRLRIRRVRQTKEALEKTKHTLVTYISEHAPSTCESNTVYDCDAAVDGVVVMSCGHFAFLCAHHGSMVMRSVQGPVSPICTDPRFDLHEKPAEGISLEWEGLA